MIVKTEIGFELWSENKHVLSVDISTIKDAVLDYDYANGRTSCVARKLELFFGSGPVDSLSVEFNDCADAVKIGTLLQEEGSARERRKKEMAEQEKKMFPC